MSCALPCLSPDVSKERGETHAFSSKAQSDFAASAIQGTGLDGCSARTSARRRFSVSGDGRLLVDSRFAESSRRGSPSDAADAKEEFAFGAGLAPEADKRVALQKNALDKYVSFGPGAQGVEPRAAPPLSAHSPNAHCGTESDHGAVEGAAGAPCHMTPEEGQLQLQAINCTWDEIQSRIRDETIRAQSVIEKYDEEQRRVDEHVGNQTIPDSYDKSHLLAALRAIEEGGDPVDLNNEVAEQRSQLSLSTSKDVEYRNMSQVVENIHRGIPIHTSSSVSAIERSQTEHSNFWESNTLMSPGFLSNEIERPRTNSDIMHNYFGSEKY